MPSTLQQAGHERDLDRVRALAGPELGGLTLPRDAALAIGELAGTRSGEAFLQVRSAEGTRSKAGQRCRVWYGWSRATAASSSTTRAAP